MWCNVHRSVLLCILLFESVFTDTCTVRISVPCRCTMSVPASAPVYLATGMYSVGLARLLFQLQSELLANVHRLGCQKNS